MKDTIKSICIIFFLLCGCLPGIGEWNITELYKLKIEGSSKIIYKYDAWGGRDSNVFGYIVLDSMDTFELNIRKTLPISYLSDIPSKNKIYGVTYNCYNSCGDDYYKTVPIYKPREVENLTQENIEIENLIFQYRGFSARESGLRSYHFESFKETRDSIFFYNLDELENINGIHLDSLKLKKRMIQIKQNDNQEVVKLILEDLNIDKRNNEILSKKTFFLTPKNKIKVDAFSDYGIFKPITLE